MLLSLSVFLLLTQLKMAVTIKLNCELECRTVEVNHVRTDAELPPKLLSADLSVLQL